MHGIPFVGADALSLGVTLDKVVAKKLFISDGIPTPRYFVAHYQDDLKKKNTIGYPLIVKTRMEGSSKGIHQDSKVNNLQELTKRVEFININYRQTALVEEFISGMECTVPVLGNKNPIAMPVAQVNINGTVDLGDEFYTNDRIYSDALKYVVPALFPEHLTAKVQDIAIEVYNSVESRDFGRIDFRIDKKGNPYVLEINPLPTLDLEDVFNMFPQLFGSTYADVVNLILNLALSRYGMIKKTEQELLTTFMKKEVPVR
jgi:D-alanine-D-alanine ligase